MLPEFSNHVTDKGNNRACYLTQFVLQDQQHTKKLRSTASTYGPDSNNSCHKRHSGYHLGPNFQE